MMEDKEPTSAVAAAVAPALHQGGWRTAPFLLVLQGCDAACFAAIAINMVTFLMQHAHFAYSDAAVMTTNFLGISFLTLPHGFFADAYLGRFPAIMLFGLVEVLGLILLTITASVPSLLRAPPCIQSEAAKACAQVEGKRYALLMVAIFVIAVGSGGVRVNVASHGADQFQQQGTQEEQGQIGPSKRSISSFFNWLFFSINMGLGIACTLLVYMQENLSFGTEFAVGTGLLVFGLAFALSAYRLYWFEPPAGSPLSRVLQVLIAAARNRKHPLPSSPSFLYEDSAELNTPRTHHARQSTPRLQHTEQLRFLDKAAINSVDVVSVQGRKQIDNGESTSKPSRWRVCTVSQVEEVKALAGMMPIWATTIISNVCQAQLVTFSIEQGTTTDRHILGKARSFQIPAASLIAFPVLMLILLSPLYELIFVPFARMLTGHPAGISQLQRMGAGLFISSLSMAAAGAVERRRRHVAESHGLVDDMGILAGKDALPMSVMWLAPQYMVFGLAEFLFYVGIMELFYQEASEGMRSLGTGFSQTTNALGYLLSSSTVNIVKSVTDWLPDNINRARLDYFYWMLAVLNLLSFGLFLLCAKSYKYRPRSQY